MDRLKMVLSIAKQLDMAESSLVEAGRIFVKEGPLRRGMRSAGGFETYVVLGGVGCL